MKEKMNQKADYTSTYYISVAQYFDIDSKDFEKRYIDNPILQKIRQEFRKETEDITFTNALEIGCGPGFDLAYFAKKYPQRKFSAIDVSRKMVHLAQKNTKQFSNVSIRVGTQEQISRLFPKKKFDLIYCYFGGLNTVHDFQSIERQLRNVLTPNGKLVLTFINRWYLFDVAFNVGLLRFSKAFSRLRGTWKGYSPKRVLQSTPRSAKEIKTLFSPSFSLKLSKSYSIFYPAWYRSHWPFAKGKLGKILWRIDIILNKTPLRYCGEYSLYILQAKN